MSETKPERRRRDSSRGLGKDKRNKAKKQDISTLLFGAANGVSPLRGSQTSNGDAHFPTLRAGLTSDRASGADLWQCAPSFVAKCMKLPVGAIRAEHASAAATRNGNQSATTDASFTKPQRRRRAEKLAQPARAGKR